MKRLLLLALVLLLAGCAGHRTGNAGTGLPLRDTGRPFACRGGNLKTGDLVFVGIPMDYSLDEGTMDEAICASTGNGNLNLIHVAILEVEKDSTWIIDATIARGVDRYPLDTFLTNFTLKDGSLPTFIIKRLKHSRHAAEYVENAKKFIGLPYDVAFLPDNGAMYCTELVRDSYRTPDGGYIFDEKPMNFKNAEGEFPLYWQQLFALIGQEIPQGIPGTNPQDMSQAPCLSGRELSLSLQQ